MQQSLEPNHYNSLEFFELSGKLGKGQFSEVLRARNRLTGKMVAMKKIEVAMAFWQIDEKFILADGLDEEQEGA